MKQLRCSSLSGIGWRLGIFAMLCALPTSLFAGPSVRRALVVGISDYKIGAGTTAASQLISTRATNLLGAAGDAQAVAAALTPRGFAGHLRTLINQEATRARILAELDEFLLKPEKHDEKRKKHEELVLFYFAGHGSFIPGSDPGSPFGHDETLAPADSNLGVPDIRDKELLVRFERARASGMQVVVIFDSCHSASMLRGVPAETIDRYIPPQTTAVAPMNPMNGASPVDRPGALFLAAAAVNEAAQEKKIDGAWHGVFTFALLTALQVAPPGETVAALELRVRSLVQAYGGMQTPTFSGTPARLRAGLWAETPSRPSRLSAAVESIDASGQLILNAGLAVGLGIGAELTGSGEQRSVKLTVTDVLGLARSVARVLPAATPGQRPLIPIGALFEARQMGQPPIGKRAHLFVASSDLTSAMLEQTVASLSVLQRHPCLRWIPDATAESASIFVSYRDGVWQLRDTRADGTYRVTSIGRLSRPAEVGERILAALSRLGYKLEACRDKSRPTLAVGLPPPGSLAQTILAGSIWREWGLFTAASEVEADYVLTGRLGSGGIEYAWVRPNADEHQASLLPLRGAWFASRERSVIQDLQRSAAGLSRVMGWQTIQAPVGTLEFAYALGFRRSSGDQRRYVRGPQLPEVFDQENFKAVLTPKKMAAVKPRHVYIFTLDQYGNSRLIYPLGNEQALRPTQEDLGREIVTQATFNCEPEFGIDTLIMLTTDVPLSNPGDIFTIEDNERHGIPRGSASTLEEFLLSVGGPMRSPPPAAPIDWTIERFPRRCLPRAPGSRRVY